MDCLTETGAKDFDGIICIGGEDWWYHNRGHFDFQIMRRLAQRMPVLFVNSLGVRMPSVAEPSQFASRITRKLKSLLRGLERVENQFYVFSPASVPGPLGQKLSSFALGPQIKRAARRAGITRPVLWMHCPAGASLVSELSPVAVVMQRTDRFEAFPEGDPVVLGDQVATIKTAADLVVYCASHLMGEETGTVKRQLLVTHGVDLDSFAAAGQAKNAIPADMANIPSPRAGFIGGIDAHTFDPELFLTAVRQLPHVSFVMIGGCSLPENWCPYPNIHFLGRKPYDTVASYMAAMDVLLMPWNKSDWIQACNPIKLKEYLAVGRPVVTTDFPALAAWRDLVHVADDGVSFANAIRAALAVGPANAEVMKRLESETWDAKADLIADAIGDLGVTYRPAGR